MTSRVVNYQDKIGHVLIIENDHLYACIIGEMLKEGSKGQYEVTLTHSIAEALESLQQRPCDVILLDIILAGEEESGLYMTQLQESFPHLPILVMTRTDDEALALQALQAGAQDYLVKGQFRVQELMRALRYARERQRLKLALEESMRQKLLTSEQRFQRLITQSADGIVVINRENMVLFANPAAELLLAQAAGEMLGTHFGYSISPAETSELVIRQNNQILAIAEARVVETEWQGQPALLISLRDITTHKRTERTLRQLAADLQARNEELDAFAHTVAHDLKGPIGVMIGYAETLLQDYLTIPREELGEHLISVARSGRKATDIIRELLLLASVHKEPIAPQMLTMGHIVDEVQERLQTMIDQYQAQLIVPKAWPVAYGYGPWVEEVWSNYISNAIKYGGKPPRIELGATPRPDGMVAFWVADNGTGLTAEEKTQLFTPFPKLERMAKGNGLGLSIVRRIVNRLNGQVGVRSEPGQGSTFYFTLPRTATSG